MDCEVRSNMHRVGVQANIFPLSGAYLTFYEVIWHISKSSFFSVWPETMARSEIHGCRLSSAFSKDFHFLLRHMRFKQKTQKLLEGDRKISTLLQTNALLHLFNFFTHSNGIIRWNETRQRKAFCQDKANFVCMIYLRVVMTFHIGDGSMWSVR